ncbi:hypothetical protein N7507_010360, partial [Penicillium longicatenatum]
ADLTTASAVDVLFHLVLKDFGIFNIVINTMGKVLNRLTEIAEDINSEPAVFILKAAVMYPTAAIISVVTALLVPLSLNILRTLDQMHLLSTSIEELQARQVSVNDVAPEPMDTLIEYHKSSGIGNRLTMVQGIARLIRFLCMEGT